MLPIDLKTVCGVLLATVFLCTLIICIIVSKRNQDAKSGQQSICATTKLYTILMVVGVIHIILAVLIVIGLSVDSRVDIGELLANLQTSDKIILNDHFLNFENSKFSQADLIISDSNIIKNVSELMKKTSIKRTVKIHRLYRVTDYIEVKVFQKNMNVSSFILTCQGLENNGWLMNRIYLYADSESSNLLSKLRKELFPNRSQCWPEVSRDGLNQNESSELSL